MKLERSPLMPKTLFDLSVRCANNQILAKPSNEIVFWAFVGRRKSESSTIFVARVSHVSHNRPGKEGLGSPCHLQHHRGNEQCGETSRDTREDVACAEISDYRGHDLLTVLLETLVVEDTVSLPKVSKVCTW